MVHQKLGDPEVKLYTLAHLNEDIDKLEVEKFALNEDEQTKYLLLP